MTREVTITSKNQITLPVDMVRKLKLQRNRTLNVELKGETIKITAKPELTHELRQLWGRHKFANVLSDEEIKQAARRIAGERNL